MKKLKRLRVTAETIRLLTTRQAQMAVGGEVPVSRAQCGTSATNGNTECPSEASGCASICEWSCINQSCTVQSEHTGTGG